MKKVFLKLTAICLASSVCLAYGGPQNESHDEKNVALETNIPAPTKSLYDMVQHSRPKSWIERGGLVNYGAMINFDKSELIAKEDLVFSEPIDDLQNSGQSFVMGKTFYIERSQVSKGLTFLHATEDENGVSHIYFGAPGLGTSVKGDDVKCTLVSQSDNHQLIPKGATLTVASTNRVGANFSSSSIAEVMQYKIVLESNFSSPLTVLCNVGFFSKIYNQKRGWFAATPIDVSGATKFDDYAQHIAQVDNEVMSRVLTVLNLSINK